jgi:serine/threonine protein phosphatase PrpC
MTSDPSLPTTRHVAVAAATDVGHVRRRNEDHAVVGTTVLGGERGEHTATVEPPAMLAVMDGLGGHPAGDVASGLVAEVVAAAEVPVGPERVADLVAAMQQRIVDHVDAHPETAMMGTTLSGASLLDASTALVIGVGDSVSLWFTDRLHLAVPRDRSPGGWITQTLGGGDALEPVRPHVVKVSGPGRLLLASDGLTDLVSADEIAAVLGDGADPTATVRVLVRTALERGGHDNVTVVLADLQAPA